MSHRSWHPILSMVLLLAACARPATPDHYGFFILNDAEQVELPQFKGAPERNQWNGLPSALTEQPNVLAWWPDLELTNLSLRAAGGVGEDIDFTARPQNNGEVLVLTPSDGLATDVYCFIQGDPLGQPFGLPHWCFRVGDPAGSVSLLPTATLPGQNDPATTAPALPSPTAVVASFREVTRFNVAANGLQHGGGLVWADNETIIAASVRPSVISIVNVVSGAIQTISIDEPEVATDLTVVRSGTRQGQVLLTTFVGGAGGLKGEDYGLIRIYEVARGQLTLRHVLDSEQRGSHAPAGAVLASTGDWAASGVVGISGGVSNPSLSASFWDLRDETESGAALQPAFSAPGGLPNQFSPDGTTIMLIDPNINATSAMLWSVTQQQVINSLSIPPSFSLLHNAFVPASDLFLGGGQSTNGSYAWSMTTGQIMYNLPRPASALAVSPNGELVLTASVADVSFWNAADGTLLGTVPVGFSQGNTGIIRFAFRPDGQRLAIVSFQGEVIIWEKVQ